MKKEKIIAITEHEKNNREGYKIITTEQEIILAIDNGQSCCESWGYFWCNEKPEFYVGATLHGIELTDAGLSEAIMKKEELDPNSEYFEGGIMFVNLKTSKGVLQFVAYNKHNGYYGHEALIKSTQLNHSDYI
jgi:hypothetical protein